MGAAWVTTQEAGRHVKAVKADTAVQAALMLLRGKDAQQLQSLRQDEQLQDCRRGTQLARFWANWVLI